MLLEKITKEHQKSKKLLEEVKAALPVAYKERDLEEIDVFFEDYRDATVETVLHTAIELKLLDDNEDEEDLLDMLLDDEEATNTIATVSSEYVRVASGS